MTNNHNLKISTKAGLQKSVIIWLNIINTKIWNNCWILVEEPGSQLKTLDKVKWNSLFFIQYKIPIYFHKAEIVWQKANKYGPSDFLTSDGPDLPHLYNPTTSTVSSSHQNSCPLLRRSLVSPPPPRSLREWWFLSELGPPHTSPSAAADSTCVFTRYDFSGAWGKMLITQSFTSVFVLG